MKRPKILLSNFEGSGPLSVSWRPAPYSIAATEALNEIGVGFFLSGGELLSVIFDDVEWEKDHQILEFKNYTVEATVKKGKVSIKLSEKHSQKHRAA